MISKNGQFENRDSGFTLIELLVVIAIISLLVSILLPSLTKAKDLARAVVCQTNLHQIGLAVSYYTEEYTGYIPYNTGPVITHSLTPGGTSWSRMLMLKILDIPQPQPGERPPGAFACPAAPEVTVVVGAYQGLTAASDYAKNWFINCGVSSELAGPSDPYYKYTGWTMDKFSNPSAWFLVADATLYLGNLRRDLHFYPTGMGDHVSFRHPGERANMLYLDSHLEPLIRDDVYDPPHEEHWVPAADNAKP